MTSNITNLHQQLDALTKDAQKYLVLHYQCQGGIQVLKSLIDEYHNEENKIPANE